jgi:hypothetical protein
VVSCALLLSLASGSGFGVRVLWSGAALLPRITRGTTGDYRRGLEVLVFTDENGTSRERCNAFA